MKFNGSNKNSTEGSGGHSAQVRSNTEYDVDRWERTEWTYELPDITNVQAVREDWERSGRKRFLKKRADDKEAKEKRTSINPAFSQTKERPASKPAESEPNRLLSRMDDVKRIMDEAQSSPVKGSALDSTSAYGITAYSKKSNLPESLVASPVNTALLAIDTLSLGPLTMEQTNPLIPYAATPSNDNTEAETDGSCMDKLRIGRSKKYVVRIV